MNRVSIPVDHMFTDPGGSHSFVFFLAGPTASTCSSFHVLHTSQLSTYTSWPSSCVICSNWPSSIYTHQLALQLCSSASLPSSFLHNLAGVPAMYLLGQAFAASDFASSCLLSAVLGSGLCTSSSVCRPADSHPLPFRSPISCWTSTGSTVIAAMDGFAMVLVIVTLLPKSRL